MTTKQIRQLGNIVGIVIGVNRQGVINLLRQHDVVISEDITNDTLISETIEKITSDEKFRNSINQMLSAVSNVTQRASQRAASFDGYEVKGKLYDQGYSSAEGSSFDWGGAIGGLTSLGGTLIATSAQKKLAEQQAKIAQQEAQTQIALGANQLEIEKLRLAQIQAQKVSSGTGNTMLYVGIGLVVVLVIGGIFIALKK